MRREYITRSPRFAGSVLRYHTWPTIQTQTVADHTFHVLRIYSALFGPPLSEVTEYILRHDLGEIITGDLPFPVKSKHLKLKEYVDALEEYALEEMNLGATPEITDDQRRRIKICDLIEMHEFGRVEMCLGNVLCEPVVEDTLGSALQLAEEQEVDLIMDYLATSVGGL